MTDEEKEVKRVEAQTKREKVIKARKAEELKNGFLNPLGEGTTLVEFNKAVSDSKVTLEEYCADHLTEEELSSLKVELKHFDNKNKK